MKFQKFIGLAFFGLLVLSGCQSTELQEKADELKQKAVEVKDEAIETKEKTEQKIKDINTAVDAVNKVLGTEEEKD